MKNEKQKEYDLILMDIQMPLMSGIDYISKPIKRDVVFEMIKKWLCAADSKEPGY